MSEFIGIRGRVWFKALTGQSSPMQGDPHSVLTADAPIGEDKARFLCVVPDPDGRFPCARRGEVGLQEAYTLAARVREAIDTDKESKKRPIIAIVDVKSQAYGRREEIAYSSSRRSRGRRICNSSVCRSPLHRADRWARDLWWIPHAWLPGRSPPRFR